ncbi:MAG: hypothetical protein LCH41_04400 [Armatimonadetes bacterium]|nr:hypothetical protein [Armatimonadota bacterium]
MSDDQEVFFTKRVLDLEELHQWLVLGYIGVFTLHSGACVYCFKVIGGSPEGLALIPATFICLMGYGRDGINGEEFDIDLCNQAVRIGSLISDPRQLSDLGPPTLRWTGRGHLSPGSVNSPAFDD